MIDSQSLMTTSPTPSCTNRKRSFSVETTISSDGAKSLLVKTLGKRSLAACSASIHADLSSLDMQRKWRVFVPVNMDSLLSSDLLARIEDTCKPYHSNFSYHSKRELWNIKSMGTHCTYHTIKVVDYLYHKDAPNFHNKLWLINYKVALEKTVNFS